MAKDNHKPKNWDYKKERRLAEVRKEDSKLHFYQYDKNGTSFSHNNWVLLGIRIRDTVLPPRPLLEFSSPF